MFCFEQFIHIFNKAFIFVSTINKAKILRQHVKENGRILVIYLIHNTRILCKNIIAFKKTMNFVSLRLNFAGYFHMFL